MEAYEQLEQEWGKWSGVENVVAAASGTAALHLALESLRLPAGSEVLVPDFGMVACPRAVSAAGLMPVFVDCRPDLLVDLDELDRAAALSYDVRAVLVVHIYGRQVPMDQVHVLAAKYGLAVIEDLAEAHGIQPHPQTDAACWSFYRNKIVSGEEGGAVAFRDHGPATLARQLRCLGFTPSHDFTHLPRGWNHRLSNAHARLVLESLARVRENLAERRRLEALCESLCPPEWRMPPRAVPWVFDCRIPGMRKAEQDAAVEALQCAGIPARHAFRPMSHQEEYQRSRTFTRGVAARLSEEVTYLPLVPGQLRDEDYERAFAVLQDSFAISAAARAR